MKYIPNYIKGRVDRNQNFVMLFVGQIGTGKSYAAMSLGEQIDPGFDINRIVFSADEFVEALNKDESLVRGSVIMWDEAGVGMPPREWYSISSKTSTGLEINSGDAELDNIVHGIINDDRLSINDDASKPVLGIRDTRVLESHSEMDEVR